MILKIKHPCAPIIRLGPFFFQIQQSSSPCLTTGVRSNLLAMSLEPVKKNITLQNAFPCRIEQPNSCGPDAKCQLIRDNEYQCVCENDSFPPSPNSNCSRSKWSLIFYLLGNFWTSYAESKGSQNESRFQNIRFFDFKNRFQESHIESTSALA